MTSKLKFSLFVTRYPLPLRVARIHDFYTQLCSPRHIFKSRLNFHRKWFRDLRRQFFKMQTDHCQPDKMETRWEKRNFRRLDKFLLFFQTPFLFTFSKPRKTTKSKFAFRVMVECLRKMISFFHARIYFRRGQRNFILPPPPQLLPLYNVSSQFVRFDVD